MKLFFKYLSIFVILVTITSCSNKENEENVTSDTTKEILTESNVNKDIITDSNEDKQIVSGTFGSDGAFTSETIKIEVSENAPEEEVNGQTYDKIFEEFIFHITDPTEYTGLSDKTKLLEQFIDKNNNKFGKFYIQKTLANYIFYYYSTMPEGLAGKEYILFDEKSFTSKVTISQFELDKPEFSKNNNFNNFFIENIYLLELEKNAINKLPNFSSKVDALLQKIFTRDSEARLFDTNSVNLFFIFELLNSKNEKQICTLVLPSKISLYTMDADYGSSYDNFYKNSTDTIIKANLPNLSSVVGKIQAFTSFYTTCISA
jgi:hypothetical protein